METITQFIAPKTIGIAFGESASVLDLCTLIEKEEYGYNHPATTSTSYVGRTQGSFDGLEKVRNKKTEQ